MGILTDVGVVRVEFKHTMVETFGYRINDNGSNTCIILVFFKRKVAFTNNTSISNCQ